MNVEKNDKNEVVDTPKVVTKVQLEPVHLMSFGFDYETNEIVARIKVDEGEFRELRLCKKDLGRMYSWFDIAEINRATKHMKQNLI